MFLYFWTNMFSNFFRNCVFYFLNDIVLTKCSKCCKVKSSHFKLFEFFRNFFFLVSRTEGYFAFERWFESWKVPTLLQNLHFDAILIFLFFFAIVNLHCDCCKTTNECTQTQIHSSLHFIVKSKVGNNLIFIVTVISYSLVLYNFEYECSTHCVARLISNIWIAMFFFWIQLFFFFFFYIRG